MKILLITLIAFLSLGCAGLRSAIPTVRFDVSDEEIDLVVHSHVDKTLFCVPEKVGNVPFIGDVLKLVVGVCQEEPAA